MKITFTDKTSIDNRPDLSDVEKITGGNINEIKNVVNTNADELESTKVKTENLSTDVEALKQKDTDQDKNIQSNTSKIEAINKSIEAINKKNTEQDTNLQKNAKDIEVNQNNIKALQVENAEVKAENERLRSDIESISLLGEAEGESIDLDDSSGARFKKFGVGGNHSQETREGYNIVDLTSFPKGARNGITATVDLNKGSITLNGTCTGTFAYAIPLALNAGTVVSYGLNNLQTNSEVTMRFEVTDNTQEGQILCAQKNAKMENFALTKDTVSWQLRIGKGTVLTNFVIYPQIEVGSTLHKFETYGATPSLEFPSEIKTVKDNVNIVVCNENLFKETSNNKKINTAYGYLISGNYMLKKGKKYAVSFDTNNNGGKVYLNEDVLKFFGTTYDAVCDGKRHTIKATAIVDGYQSNRNLIKTSVTTTDYYDVSNISVCEYVDDGSSDFVEHQEQAITMPVQQEMLRGDYFDWVNEKEVHTWRKEICNGTEKWIQQQTTSAGYWYIHDVGGKGITSGYSQDILCNKLKGINPNEAWNGTKDGINVSNNINVYLKEYSQNKTLDDFKKMLSENPLEIYYKVKKQIELPFTDEQKAVAKKIKETLHTYKNITHIYSTDETSPIMNVEYAKDLNTVINNMQAQIINNASEEVNG